MAASQFCQLLLVNFYDEGCLDGLPPYMQYILSHSEMFEERIFYAPLVNGRKASIDFSRTDCCMQIVCRTFRTTSKLNIDYRPKIFNRNRSVLVRVVDNGHNDLPSLQQPVTLETLHSHGQLAILKALQKAVDYSLQHFHSFFHRRLKCRMNQFRESI